MQQTFTRPILLFILFISISLLGYSQQVVPTCGTNDSLTEAYLARYARKVDLTQARTAAAERLEYRLALDINYRTYELYKGDKKVITEAAYKFIQQASEIFEREINVKLVVTSILIWDKPEPYALNEDFDYFSNVLSYWQANRFEPRDAVVSLSTRSGWFYGGFRMCSANFPNPYYPEIQVDLLAHELGHTLGSPHTHNCSWPGGPIDYCSALETNSDTCQTAYTENVNGSLMSYCRNNMSFHPLCRNLMRDFAAGLVTPEFKLAAQSSIPATPIIRPGSAINQSLSPAFEWNAPLLSDSYDIQLSGNETFTSIAEDTVVYQSYFQSAGLAPGYYFARIRAKNETGTSSWSPAYPFTVAAFSDNTEPPVLFDLNINNDWQLTGQFRKVAGIEAYQIETERLPAADNQQTYNFTMNANSRQDFTISLPAEFFSNYNVRLRVKAGNVWSKWSEPKSAVFKFDSQPFYPPIDRTTASPVLATSILSIYPNNGLTEQIEVAADQDFKEIIYAGEAQSNEMNAPRTYRGIFTPELPENSELHYRTRLQWEPGKYTNWKSAQFSTGMDDQRFEHLSSVSKNLRTGYVGGENYKSRLYATAEKLYVYDYADGYYATEDLLNWKEYTVRSTRGKSPNQVYMFGASESGRTYVFNSQNLLQTEGNSFNTLPLDGPLQSKTFGPIAVTSSSGIFLPTSNLGVARYSNSGWRFYGRENLGSTVCTILTKDKKDQVWAMMAGGTIYLFADEKWTRQPDLPEWTDMLGFAFDQDNNCYAYGAWGLTRLDRQGQKWQRVQEFEGRRVHKVVFDNNNVLWAAVFTYTGIPGQEYSDFGLAKYNSGKATFYENGIGLLRETFDIEVFKKKLVILTASGEIHAFDENKIQRFNPRPSYQPGEQTEVSITTNSTFSKSNVFSFELRNTASNVISTVRPLSQAGPKLILQIPETLPPGNYTLRTLTSQPELKSNESAAFDVFSKEQPAELVLMQNKPNPVGKESDISYYIPADGEIALELFNVRGQKLATMASGFRSRGWHHAAVDGNAIPGGIYIYRLKAGGRTKSLKMVR